MLIHEHKRDSKNSLGSFKNGEWYREKWIGLLYHDYHNTKIRKNIFNIIMYRASVLAPTLAEHGYKLICYTPNSVNKETKTVDGFIFENNQFKEAVVSIPKTNHDFYIGPDDLKTYREFRNWAKEHGYKLYPSRGIRNLAQDKLLAAQVISKLYPSIIPLTEAFDGSAEMVQKYLLEKSLVFIKPRFGGRGNKIIVVKSENNQFIAEYYTDIKKEIVSFGALAECVSYVNNLINNEKYIIQEAVDVVRFEGSVFDIRSMVFNEGSSWYFLGELRTSIKESEISNNGGVDIPIEFLTRVFSKEKAEFFLEKIKEITINLTKFLSQECKELINELAFDVMIDKSDNIYLAEINTKAGLNGPTKYGDFFNMTESEKRLYENLPLPHGHFLAKSLMYRDV